MNTDRSPLQIAIRKYSTPLLYAEEIEASHHQIDVIGGSALLWECNGQRFIVTNAHVWIELATRHAKQVDKRRSVCANLGLGLISLNGATVVDINEELDLAVITHPEFSGLDLSTGTKSFYKASNWPPSPAVEGENVGFIGFAGQYRKTEGFTMITDSFYHEEACNIAVGRRKILMGAFRDREPEIRKHAPNVENLKDAGGASGAPVFALRAEGPVWIGTVGRGTEQAGSQTSYQATPSNLIRSDGTIIAQDMIAIIPR